MNIKSIVLTTVAAGILFSCGDKTKKDTEDKVMTSSFELKKFDNSGEFSYQVDKFGDIEVIRYKIPSWDKLSLQQKKYAYYLTWQDMLEEKLYTIKTIDITFL